MGDKAVVRGAYDDAYQRSGPLFGLQPDAALKDIVRTRVRSGRALDIGAGEGRHSIFLARNSFTVEAVDLSEEAVDRLREFARRGRLQIEARVGDCAEPECITGQFDLIVADTVLGHFDMDEAQAIGRRIVEALAPRGWLFVTALSCNDPRESEFASLSWTYFTRDELVRLFPGLRVEKCEELRTIDRSHGEPHRHRVLRLIAQKEEA